MQAVRNQYAQTYNLPARNDTFDWKDVTTMVGSEQPSGGEEE